MVERMAERERLERQVEETLNISTIIILFGNPRLSKFRRQQITNIFLGGGKEGGGFPRWDQAFQYDQVKRRTKHENGQV